MLYTIAEEMIFFFIKLVKGSIQSKDKTDYLLSILVLSSDSLHKKGVCCLQMFQSCVCLY